MSAVAKGIRAVRYSRGNLVAWLMLFLLFTVLMLKVCVDSESPVEIAFPALPLALFAFMSIVTIRWLFHRDPVLVLDEEGITDDVYWASAGRVPWSEITGAHTQRSDLGSAFWRPTYLVVDVRNLRQFVERGSRRQREAKERVLQRYGSPVAIPATLIDADAGELVEMIQLRVGAK